MNQPANVPDAPFSWAVNVVRSIFTKAQICPHVIRTCMLLGSSFSWMCCLLTPPTRRVTVWVTGWQYGWQ